MRAGVPSIGRASTEGTPARSIPWGGGSAARLPIGLQIATRGWDEALAPCIAAAYERAPPWKTRYSAP